MDNHFIAIQGNSVCAVGAWYFRNVLNNFLAGQSQRFSHHSKKFKTGPTLKTEVAHAFLKCKFKELGEYVPHKDVIYLPGDTK
jgi:hypothetical protein